eukprot:c18227_g1_i1.p1 GENE.c18227_g1_i1~~c18227_g1_i1.p1  ORF type:complete len:307 (-),score=48.34 c18227_g1_i1:12-866(-)
MFTQTAEHKECQPLLAKLKSATISHSDKLISLSRLFDMCHMTEHKFRKYQHAICDLGGVNVIVQVAQEAEHEDVLSWVFNVLGQLGFNNERTSFSIGSCPLLLPLVLQTVNNSISTQKLKKHAIYSLTNVIANAWSTHAQLLKIVPYLLSFLHLTETTKELKSQSILTIGNFAYNPESRPTLIAAGAHLTLISVLSSKDADLLPTSSSIAIANLLASVPSNSLSIPNDVLLTMCLNIVGALDLTLERLDCPRGSGVFYTVTNLKFYCTPTLFAPARLFKFELID